MTSTPAGGGRSGRAVHLPVLMREVLRWLDLSPGLTVVDGTVGAGGHSGQIHRKLGETGRLIGLDRDPMMLDLARGKLSADNIQLQQASYSELRDVLDGEGIPAVDRVLLDLGLSSDQLADNQRGFGFQAGGPLDLRFDTSRGKPAWKLLQQLDAAELEAMFRDYGEERFSREIAEAIVKERSRDPVRTADDLLRIVEQAIPAAAQAQARRQPATRVFQALRIAANDELGHLERMLKSVLPGCLKAGGRAVIISFHSLEDRLVKNEFRDAETWQNLTPRPITASTNEKKLNPRSRSAKLRAAIRR